MRRIDGRAVDGVGHVGRAAAAGIARDLKFGAGRAAAGFGPDARHDLQQVGGTRWAYILYFLETRRSDLEAGIELLETLGLGGSSHHDLIEGAGVGGAGIAGCRRRRGWGRVLAVGVAARQRGTAEREQRGDACE